MTTKEDRLYYERAIISRFTPIYDFLLPLFGFTMLSVAIVNFVNEIDIPLSIFRIFMAVTFFLFYIFRKKLSVTFRVVSGTLVFLIVAVINIYTKGISVVSLVILIIIVIASIIFLPKIYRYIYSGIITFFLLSIPILHTLQALRHPIFPTNESFYFPEYFSTMAGFLLVTLMILLAFNHLANIHIEIIKNLENQINLTNEKSNQINQLAYYDTLTGLPNKELFRQKIEPLLPSEGSYLVLLDIRNFESINFLHGVDVGERILEKFGEEFTSFLTHGVQVAHISGNEFAFFIQNMSEQEIIELISSGIETFNTKYFSIIGFKKIRFNIALVPTTNQDSDFHKLFEKAILTLRECKNKPNQVYIKFDPSLMDSAYETEKILTLVEREIEENGFEVYYQEKVDSLSEEVIGVEALSRLKTENNQFISPCIFIPLIEKSNLAVPFGKLIIHKVFQDLPRLHAKYGRPISISINISPTHLLSENFVNYLQQCSDKCVIHPQHIILEITEEVFIADYNEVKKILTKLKSEGFNISIDDFGSGYSSLNYISELPLDEVKVDQSFMKQVLNNEKAELMLRIIFEIAKTLDYSIVVEGVETKEQLALLRNIGTCDIQGYLFSRPSKLI